MNTKYPRQIIAVKRKDKVFGVDCALAVPGEKDNASPLETVGYSRFVATIVDNSQGEMIAPKANIPADEVKYIKFRTELAIHKMELEKRPISANSQSDNKNADSAGLKNSPAYTQKLFDKQFKGKTPAEVICENPDNKTELIRIREWLNANLDKYPNNKLQINAIDDAITLFDIGELSCDKAEGPSNPVDNTIEVYNTDFKFFSTIKEGTTNEHLIYNINITCDPSKKYPFIINVQNCYAPVESGQGGQKIIKMSAANTIKKSSIMMTEKEWFSVISKMDTVLNNFEALTFPEQYEIMKCNSYQG